MTREISRKAAVSDISETRKWCLALGFDVFGFIYIYMYIYSVRVRGKFVRESWKDVALRNINSAI